MIERTLNVDQDGWVIIPSDVKVEPPLPGNGPATHVKVSNGEMLLRQRTTAGLRLWMLCRGSWIEVEGGNA